MIKRKFTAIFLYTFIDVYRLMNLQLISIYKYILDIQLIALTQKKLIRKFDYIFKV
jgi:hypothetical protein